MGPMGVRDDEGAMVRLLQGRFGDLWVARRRILSIRRVKDRVVRGLIMLPGFALLLAGFGRAPSAWSGFWQDLGLPFILVGVMLPWWSRSHDVEGSVELADRPEWSERVRRVLWRTSSVLVSGSVVCLLTARWQAARGNTGAVHGADVAAVVLLVSGVLTPLVKWLLRPFRPAGERRAERVQELTRLLLRTQAVIEPGLAWSDLSFDFDPERGASGRPLPFDESDARPVQTVDGPGRSVASAVLHLPDYDVEVRGRKFVIVSQDPASRARRVSLPIAPACDSSTVGTGPLPRAVAELVWFGDSRSGFCTLLFLDSQGFRLAEFPDFPSRSSSYVFPLAAAAGVHCVAYQIRFPRWGYKEVLDVMFPPEMRDAGSRGSKSA